MSVLGIDSNYDLPTQLAHDYRNTHVYPQLPSVIKRQGTLATRAFVKLALKKNPNIRLITGVGHGLADLYTGHFGDPIFKVDDYQPVEIQGKIVHLLSCQTAAELGPDMVANGAHAFMGYDVNFVFNSTYADYFFEADSAIDLALAQGRTAGDATQAAKNSFNHFINALENTDDVVDTETIALLEIDRDHLMGPSINSMFGDMNARL